MTKINLRITAKRHTRFQPLTKKKKKHAKFQKDLAKIVGGVAFTRYQVSICVGRSYLQND